MSEAALRLDSFSEPEDVERAPVAGEVIRIDFRGPKNVQREIEPYPVDHLISKLVEVEYVDDLRVNVLDGSNPLTAQQNELLAFTADEVAWWPDEDY